MVSMAGGARLVEEVRALISYMGQECPYRPGLCCQEPDSCKSCLVALERTIVEEDDGKPQGLQAGQGMASGHQGLAIHW